MQVCKEELSTCSDLHPRILSLRWHETGEPKELTVVITLDGSIGPKDLRLEYLPSPGKGIATQ